MFLGQNRGNPSKTPPTPKRRDTAELRAADKERRNKIKPEENPFKSGKIQPKDSRNYPEWLANADINYHNPNADAIRQEWYVDGQSRGDQPRLSDELVAALNILPCAGIKTVDGQVQEFQFDFKKTSLDEFIAALQLAEEQLWCLHANPLDHAPLQRAR
ncbi:MAG: hypothetical protein ACK5WY_02865 [Holosporaceae bacterium]